jgi:hypothetical protein
MQTGAACVREREEEKRRRRKKYRKREIKRERGGVG